MTINAGQFRAQILVPTLQMLDQQAGIPYTLTADYLVMGTIAQESQLGTFLVQTAGPALGIGQIEPASLAGLISSLSARQAAALATLATPAAPAHNVVGNLPYAVAITRLFYWHKPAALPARLTVAALFAYYKQWYNTAAGAATPAQWAQNWMLTGIALPAS